MNQELFSQINDQMNAIQRELELASGPEEAMLLLTGKLHMDVAHEIVWFEVLNDEDGITSWITADDADRAAPGETLVAAATLEEALYGRD